MKTKSLKLANTYLQSADSARRMRIRSIASSTAIETRQPISKIEDKLTRSGKSSRHQAKLA